MALVHQAAVRSHIGKHSDPGPHRTTPRDLAIRFPAPWPNDTPVAALTDLFATSLTHNHNQASTPAPVGRHAKSTQISLPTCIARPPQLEAAHVPQHRAPQRGCTPTQVGGGALVNAQGCRAGPHQVVPPCCRVPRRLGQSRSHDAAPCCCPHARQSMSATPIPCPAPHALTCCCRAQGLAQRLPDGCPRTWPQQATALDGVLPSTQRLAAANRRLKRMSLSGKLQRRSSAFAACPPSQRPAAPGHRRRRRLGLAPAPRAHATAREAAGRLQARSRQQGHLAPAAMLTPAGTAPPCCSPPQRTHRRSQPPQGSAAAPLGRQGATARRRRW